MNISSEIVIQKEKKLIGMCKKISYANNLTGELWRSFMPRRKDILHCVNDDLISMQMFPLSFDFNPNWEFEKWATVEVTEYEDIPHGMAAVAIPEGKYAVFHYKGLSTDSSIFYYIFTEWLPQSQYLLDNHRPHFEVLGEKYKNNAPDSEEKIFIAIKSID